jgi:site-specific DNA recombinase
MDDRKILRCACYTRKSHDDGSLEKEFNSLDAQREAVENYIASQKANGWKLLPDRYDDGGFSGGNMERPALKRLLNDVKSGKIDIICIYKLDRLSRSLLDFMKLAEMLEQHNVSFVSVTQDINTSTSAGRMMLNILMTFSEFERAVITERILNSVAGKKKRGKFCGGPAILGYDVNFDAKRLEVNKPEAKIIKLIFQRYAELGSARDVAVELNNNGYNTKTWKSKKGKIYEGKEFNSDFIYRALTNPLYIGKVHHKGQEYDGEHEAIISPELWNKAQQVLSENRRARGFTKHKMESPFKGLLKCGYCGGALGITYTKKKGRRYTYYKCIKDDNRAVSSCPLSSIPAGDTDRMILEQLSSVFRTPTLLAAIYKEGKQQQLKQEEELRKRMDAIRNNRDKLRGEIIANDANIVNDLVTEFKQVDDELTALEIQLRELQASGITSRDISKTCESVSEIWDELFPAECYHLAHLLIDKIIITKETMQMNIKTHGMASLVKELQAGNPDKALIPDIGNYTVALKVPVIVKHKRGRKVILAPDSEHPGAESPVQETMFLALARAHSWRNLIESGKVATVTKLADKLQLDIAYVTRILHLINLAPELQEAIIAGREPDGLSLNRLRRGIPVEWEEQMEVLGRNKG